MCILLMIMGFDSLLNKCKKKHAEVPLIHKTKLMLATIKDIMFVLMLRNLGLQKVCKIFSKRFPDDGFLSINLGLEYL